MKRLLCTAFLASFVALLAAPAFGTVTNSSLVISAETVAGDYGAQAAGRGGIGPVLKGNEGVTNAIRSFEAKGGQILGREVTFIINGVKVKADAVGFLNNRYYLIESKNGLGAVFTRNQGIGYPNISSGVVPIGNNATGAGLTVGQTYNDFGFFLHWGD